MPLASSQHGVEAMVHEDVAKIAGPLGLDAEMCAKIEALTLRTFEECKDEMRREPRPSDEAERLLSARQRELHAKVQELLPPSKRAQYRDVVGLAD